MRRPDPASLVGGVALVAFGAVLLSAELGALEVSFGSLAPIALAAMGAILFALGLSRRA